MKEFNGKKLIFLYLLATLFLLLTGMLGYYNRLAIDDYAYLLEEKTQGIRAATWNTYMTWDTRWAGFLLLNTALKLYQKTHTLFWYHGFSVFALVASLNLVLTRLLRLQTIFLRLRITFAYSVLFASAFFFLTFGIDETWFWVNSSVTYLWPLIFALFGLGCVLSPETQSKGNRLLGFVFFFLCGAASYEFAPVLLLGLLTLMICILYKNGIRTGSRLMTSRYSAVGIAFLACAIGYASNYFGPGNSVRQSAEPAESILHAFPVTGISFLKMILLYLLPKIPFILFFSAPWMYLGNWLGEGQAKEGRKELRKMLGFVVGLFIVLSLISLFIPAYLLSEMGPKRSLTQISFYLGLASSFFCFYLGYKQDLPKKGIHYGFYISVFACIAILTRTICVQQGIVSRYARALDERTLHLKKLHEGGNTAWIKLDPLPDSGFLYSAEISTDTAHFSNTQYQKALQLIFKVSLKQE
jgi:hypothetical protein